MLEIALRLSADPFGKNTPRMLQPTFVHRVPALRYKEIKVIGAIRLIYIRLAELGRNC